LYKARAVSYSSATLHKKKSGVATPQTQKIHSSHLSKRLVGLAQHYQKTHLLKKFLVFLLFFTHYAYSLFVYNHLEPYYFTFQNKQTHIELIDRRT
jgi:hypothetical protein